ncbi:MAG: TIGR03668 family PPOX class F420-dependent oxidoreductase [Acidimicrobiia bacterium]
MAQVAAARVARLGTVDPGGAVRLVPICFALDSGRIFSAVDHKAKTSTALARLADIERTGLATVLVDHYDDADWSQLWWVRVAGAAQVHTPADPLATTGREHLVAKYAQYREQPPDGPVYSVAVDRVAWWSART